MDVVTIPADAHRYDIAARSVLASYDIGTVLSVERLPTGGPAVRKVTTSAGAYLLKPAGRRADVALLAELPALARHGVRQAAIIRTAAGDLVSPDGYFLQEFLAGRPELEPSNTQVRAVMRAVAELHLALGRLSTGYEPDWDSVFVQVTDLSFLIRELPGLLRHYELVIGQADAAIAYLAENQAALDTLPRQLVHGQARPHRSRARRQSPDGRGEGRCHADPVGVTGSRRHRRSRPGAGIRRGIRSGR
jgi:Ser/Thr protein kinase RdoA (MazF antagonist)